jgi:SSS family solute:Na+ symporter
MQMQVQVVPLIIVIVYMVGMLLVGFLTNKYVIKDSTDYMLAGRRMGLFMVASSLSANNIGGGSTTGVAAKAFSGWGLSAAWYVLAAAVAMIPLAYFAPKIRRTLAVTIPEVVNRRFGPTAGMFTAVLNVVSLFCLTASQILASGTVVSVLTGLPLNVCILIAGFVVIFYTTMGGMLADAITDVVQFLIIFFGLLIALPFIINGAGGWQAISDALPSAEFNITKVGIVTIIGLIFNYFCTFLSGPEMVSRFSSAEDPKTAQKASILSGVMMALLAFIPTLIGLIALAENPGLDGGKGTTALMYATTNYAPAWITGAVAAAIVAATMSSADSNLLCASTIITKDIYQKYINKEVEDRKLITITRASNVIICIVSMGIALFNISLVTLNLFAFALRSAGPFAAYGLGLAVKNATKNAGLVSILVGSVAVVYWQLIGSPFGILAIVFGCFWGIVSFFLVTFIERKMGKPAAPSAYLD